MFDGRRQAGQSVMSCAVDDNLPGARNVRARDHAQQRGLAAARGAEQAEELAAPNVEADIVNGDDVAVALGDSSNADDRVGAPIVQRPVLIRVHNRFRSRSNFWVTRVAV